MIFVLNRIYEQVQFRKRIHIKQATGYVKFFILYKHVAYNDLEYSSFCCF